MTQFQKVTFILSAVILLVWCGSAGWCQGISDSSMPMQSGPVPGQQMTGAPGQFPDAPEAPGSGYDPNTGAAAPAGATGAPMDTGGDAAAVRGAGTPTGSGLSGGLGGAGIDGLIAGSPRIKASDLGLDWGTVLDARFSQDLFEVLQLSLDYTWGKFRGSKTYSGPTISYWPAALPYITHGNGVDASFNISLLSVIANLNIVPLVSSENAGSVALGPRFLFLDYSGWLNIGNSTTGNVLKGESRHRIPAFGGFINVARVSPQATWYFLFGEMARPIIPSIRVAACYGGSDNAQYTQAEVFARAQTPGGWLRTNVLGFDLWISEVYGEIGYTYRGLKEDKNTLTNFVKGINGGEHVRGDSDFAVHSLVVRAGLEF